MQTAGYEQILDELESHRKLLRDLGLGPPASISLKDRETIRAKLQAPVRSPDNVKPRKQTKHSYKQSSLGVQDCAELGTVQVLHGKQKKGKSFVIAIGHPTKYKLDGNIVPVGYQFIRSWDGHQICGRTVQLYTGKNCVCARQYPDRTYNCMHVCVRQYPDRT